MFGNKKKGFINLYLLLSGMLCSLMLVYCLKLSINEKMYVISNKRLTIDDGIYNERKENLFTLLNKQIEDKIIILNEENLKNYFDSTTGNIVNISGGSIFYNKSDKLIVLATYYDNYYHREDYYLYRAPGGKIEYEYDDTAYLEGKME